MTNDELVSVFRHHNSDPDAVGAIITAKRVHLDDELAAEFICRPFKAGNVTTMTVHELPENAGGFLIPEDVLLTISFSADGITVNGEKLEDGYLGFTYRGLHRHFLVMNPNFVQK